MRVADRTYSYETAISSTEYDAMSARTLVDRLHRRLNAGGRVWIRDAEAAGAIGAPTEAELNEVLVSGARTVVVLHDRMWGRTEATLADRAAIERRLADEGPGFLRVVLIDDAPAPAWAASVDSFVATGDDIDPFIEALVAAVEQSGGETRADPDMDVSSRASQGERWARDRDTFLTSHRAAAVLTREFDRLVDEIARRVASLDPDTPAGKPVLVRTPGRAVVQYGPVALTVSWVRLGGDSVAAGRLMVIEWEGVIRRGTQQIPERTNLARPAKPATVRREDVLMADAAGEQGWMWRREGSAFGRHTSAELGALAMDSLVHAARELGA